MPPALNEFEEVWLNVKEEQEAYISAAGESHSVHNIEAMTLLVLYNLRSLSNSGIWYMTGLAMRTCVDLGLHREAYYGKCAIV